MPEPQTRQLPARIAAVLFDMDNTLVASEDAWFAASRKLWEDAGADSTGKGILGGTVYDVVDAYLLDFPGSDRDELSQRLISTLGRPSPKACAPRPGRSTSSGG